MKKLPLRWLPVLLAALSCALPLRLLAAPCLPVSALIGQDARYEEAMRAGDQAFLKSWLADDYLWVHSLASAVDTKAAVLERAAKQPGVHKARTTSDVQAQVLGDTVVLRGLSTVEQWNADGKTWRSSRYQFMRTYVYAGGQCQLLAVQTMKVWSSDAR